MAELPVGFQDRMKELLEDEYGAFAASYDKERVQGLRFSRLKLSEEERRGGDWADRLAGRVADRTGFSLRPVPWVKEGFCYGSQDRPGKHPFHEAGLYYIQEPSAMAVVELLDPMPGDLVLDLCAAPGGKSGHIASRLEGKGLLLSNEIHPARARILSQNIERLGLRNCVVCNEESGRLVSYFPEFFDKIVVDAPCSGEGMFRKDEGARAEWSVDHVKMCAERQARILDHAAAMLKPGGRMLYSTCTFAPEENEGAVLEFLKRHGDFLTEEREHYEGFSRGKPQWAGYGRAPGRTGSETEGCFREETMGYQDESRISDFHLERTLRIMPHKLEGEGHFMAVLKKTGGTACVQTGSRSKEAGKYLNEKKKRDVLKDYQAFLKDTLAEPEVLSGRDEYVLFGDQLYLVPARMPDMTGLRVLRPGLHMGTLKKNRFEPSHGLALALRPEEVRSVCELPSDGGEVIKYLKGGSPVPASPSGMTGKGWVLITTDGFSLGWCKLAGGILKNHYPKGLRWN